MEKDLSLRSLVSTTLIAATLILLCLFPASFQSFGQSVALLSFSLLFALLLRTFLITKSALERTSLIISFLLALLGTAVVALSIRALLPSNIDLFSLFTLAFSIAFFSVIFPLAKELTYKLLSHFCPWLQQHSLSSRGRILIPDLACLEDGRLCDLVRTGLLDNQLVLPQALIQKIKMMMEDEDEMVQERARQAYESCRKLESFGIQSVPHKEFDHIFEHSVHEGLLSYAKAIGGTILSNDSAIKNNGKAEHSDVPVVFIEAIASSFKPGVPKGQQLAIKIQRLGKEPKQGIGYLDDRTMVVVNGGGDYLGRTVKAQVLSQKYSSSGKIVFCNLLEGISSQEIEDTDEEFE